MYAEAVGSAFVLSYRVGVAHSVAADQLDQLRRLGYAGTTRDELTSTSMYDFRDGAGQIVDYLLGDFEVSLADLRAYLAADIAERADSCAPTVVALQDDDMPDDRLEFAFTWSQFWESHGSDPEWQRLDTLRFELDAAAEQPPTTRRGRTTRPGPERPTRPTSPGPTSSKGPTRRPSAGGTHRDSGAWPSPSVALVTCRRSSHATSNWTSRWSSSSERRALRRAPGLPFVSRPSRPAGKAESKGPRASPRLVRPTRG